MKRLSRLAVCMALPLTCAMPIPAAIASTATTTVTVTATVIDACTVDASPLSFGNYNGISGSMHDAVAVITPTCTAGTAYAIALCTGLGSGASHATRKLTGPDGASLNYSIYTNSSRTTVWGDGTGGTSVVAASGVGLAQPVQLHGRVPAAQTAMVGSYSDTITVTVTY